MGQRGKRCAVRAEQTDRAARVSIPCKLRRKQQAWRPEKKEELVLRPVQLPLDSNTKAREEKVASEV